MVTVITELLEARLSEIANTLGVNVAYENIEFKTNGTIYLKSNILPANTLTTGLDGSMKTYQGIYQVSVVVPANTGKSTGLAMASEIINYFPVNLELSNQGFSVYIHSTPSINSAIKDETTYTIPVSIRYRADALN